MACITPASRSTGCFAADAVPITSAPAVRPSWMAAIPTPPAGASAREVAGRAGPVPLRRAGDLVADHARAGRSVGVEPEARRHVGEVDARGADADQYLAGSRNGVGTVADLEHLGRAGAGDPD